MPPVVNRKAEKEILENNLGEILSGVEGLEEETSSAIVAALARANVKTPDLIERISKTSFEKGKSDMEGSVSDTIAQIQQQIGTLAQVVSETVKQKEEIPTKSEKPSKLQDDPAYLTLLKGQQELQKNFEQLVGVHQKAQEENAQLKASAEQKDIDARAVKMIRDAGFENPETVLHLLSRHVKFKHDPSAPPDDPYGGLMAMRASDPSVPLDGENTVLVGYDYLERFKGTPDGKRFLSVPKEAAGETSFGGLETEAPIVTRGDDPFNDDAILKQLGDLGVKR